MVPTVAVALPILVTGDQIREYFDFLRSSDLGTIVTRKLNRGLCTTRVMSTACYAGA